MPSMQPDLIPSKYDHQNDSKRVPAATSLGLISPPKKLDKSSRIPSQRKTITGHKCTMGVADGHNLITQSST